MIGIIYASFVGLALIFVILGLWRYEHSELAMAGFLFLFLLSFTLIGNTLEYKTGEVTDISYSYNASGSPISEHQELNYTYSPYTGSSEKFNSVTAGFWMAVISLVSFVILLISLGRSRRK